MGSISIHRRTWPPLVPPPFIFSPLLLITVNHYIILINLHIMNNIIKSRSKCLPVYILHSGGYFRNRNSNSRSVGMIALTWALATFVFVNIYASCLTSYMSLIFQRPDVSTFKDLPTNPNYQLATRKQTTAETIFLVSYILLLPEYIVVLIQCSLYISCANSITNTRVDSINTNVYNSR